jgi:hypothetical protein
MATKNDTSSKFRIFSIAAIASLLGAAALAYLQAGSANPSAAELAALSQAIPAQAGQALAGTDGAFNQLDASVTRLAQLRRAAGPGVPGSSSQWQKLESLAPRILERRGDVETIDDAVGKITASIAPILELSNELMDRSGSTALMQEFQQHVVAVGRAVNGLSANEDAVAAAGGIADDTAFLRSVTDALSGSETALDVRPLNEQGREVALLPIIAHLSAVEAQIERISGSAAQVSGLNGVHVELVAAASDLGRAFGGGGASSVLPEFLQTPWLPLGLIFLTVLLVIVFIFINSGASNFDRIAN